MRKKAKTLQATAVIYEVFLPKAAAASSDGCPKVTVRHARDPEIMEKRLVHQLRKEMERSTLMHAVGEDDHLDPRERAE